MSNILREHSLYDVVPYISGVRLVRTRDLSPRRASTSPSPARPKPERRVRRPKAELFDEVRVFVVPRYKKSKVSGDEWRTSVCTQFKHKGNIREERYTHSMQDALAHLQHFYLSSENGTYVTEGEFCDQESCPNTSEVTVRMKKFVDNHGHVDDPYEWDKRPAVRKFCSLHSTRGDCGLEDTDSNYEVFPSARDSEIVDMVDTTDPNWWTTAQDTSEK